MLEKIKNILKKTDDSNSDIKDITEKNDFIRSVDDLTPDDICDDRKKKFSVFGFISDNLRLVLIIICAGVLVWSGYYIINTLYHYAKTDKLYDPLAGLIMGDDDDEKLSLMLPSNPDPSTPDYAACQNLSEYDYPNTDNKGSGEANAEYERIKVKLYNLKAEYPELYGWIYIPGCEINYPIMQHSDNDYYLNHSYAGQRLAAGAIFADYHCNESLMKNPNLVLYGHHMTNSTMFHSLDNYFSEKYFKEHNTIYIYTLDGMYTYKVVSVYETNKYYRYIQTIFMTDEKFIDFAYEVSGNSIHPVEGLEFNVGSRLLTLSTCTNRGGDGRIAVHAMMVSHIT